MSEAEYNNKVAEAVIAYVHRIITYDEWYSWMSLLIKNKEKENNEIQ